MKNKGYSKFIFFGGGGEGGQKRCIMGDVQVANPRNFGNHVTVRPSVSTTGIPKFKCQTF